MNASADIIPNEKLERALDYLATTDVDYANAKAEVERTEILRKRVRAKAFLVQEDGSVAERQAAAEASEFTEAADDAYVKAVAAYELLRARRQRAELVIDVWRSLEASRRKA